MACGGRKNRHRRSFGAIPHNRGIVHDLSRPSGPSSEKQSLIAMSSDEPIKNSVPIWWRIFADAKMTGLSWMPRIRCCWNRQPSNRKKSYFCVWISTGERVSYADRPQLLGLEDVLQLLAQCQVSMDQTDLVLEMISAPSTPLMTGAGRRITVVPHL